MDKVGIKQLKRDASAILRRVRENKESVEVTFRGATIAQIVPVGSETDGQGRVKAISTSIETAVQQDANSSTAPPYYVQETGQGRRYSAQETLDALRALRTEISSMVTGPVDAVELVREQRRDLGDVRS